MKLLVIILRRTLTRCYRPHTITASDWASGLRSIPGRSIIRPVCISHIAHTAIGHMPIGTGSTVHIVGSRARQPISYYGMLNGMSLSLGWRAAFTILPWGTRKTALAYRWGCSLKLNRVFSGLKTARKAGQECLYNAQISSVRHLSHHSYVPLLTPNTPSSDCIALVGGISSQLALKAYQGGCLCLSQE